LTEQSETYEKALRRYAHTGLFIFELYSDLPWNKDSVVKRINRLHSKAAEKIKKITKQNRSANVDKIIKRVSEQEKNTDDKLDQVFFFMLKIFLYYYNNRIYS
jgi:hypothetical protein